MKINEITLSGKQIKELMENFPSNGNGPWGILEEMMNRQKKLYEGLIMSYPSYSLEQKIKKDIPDSIINIEKSNGSDKLIIYLIEETIDKTIDILNNILQIYGWKISYPRNNDTPIYQEIDNRIYFKYLVDAIYDIDVSDNIYNLNRNNGISKLYHLTPYINLKKILTSGLTPKSNSKMEFHPDRIYFLTDVSNKNDLKKFLSQLFIKNSSPKRYKMEYAILKIDLNKVQKVLPIKFFNDPNMSGAVYTMENIHPNAIKPIEKAEINFKNGFDFTIDLIQLVNNY